MAKLAAAASDVKSTNSEKGKSMKLDAAVQTSKSSKAANIPVKKAKPSAAASAAKPVKKAAAKPAAKPAAPELTVKSVVTAVNKALKSWAEDSDYEISRHSDFVAANNGIIEAQVQITYVDADEATVNAYLIDVAADELLQSKEGIAWDLDEDTLFGLVNKMVGSKKAKALIEVASAEAEAKPKAKAKPKAEEKPKAKAKPEKESEDWTTEDGNYTKEQAEEIAAKLSEITETKLSYKDFGAWYDGGDDARLEKFDNAVESFLGEKTYEHYAVAARLVDKLLYELGISEKKKSGGVDLTLMLDGENAEEALEEGMEAEPADEADTVESEDEDEEKPIAEMSLKELKAKLAEVQSEQEELEELAADINKRIAKKKAKIAAKRQQEAA